MPTLPPRILIVDDHADTTRMLARLLRFHEYHVTEALTAAAALQLARAQPFDLLLSDLNLPDRPGTDLLQDIRASCPDIRAIALTGMSSDDDRAAALAAGFTAYLTKPVPIDLLLVAVRNLLAQTPVAVAESR